MRGKKFVVHISRLKKAYDEDTWKPKTCQNPLKKEGTETRRRKEVKGEDEEEREEAIIGSVPIPSTPNRNK
jgi:hypothetical protein